MSDITKCSDSACPSAELCFRFTATESENQSFANFNRPPGERKCDSFISEVVHDALMKAIEETLEGEE